MKNWADQDEDEFEPHVEVIGPDAHGIKTIIEYKYDETTHIRQKITRKVQIRHHKSLVSKNVQNRRNWAKFGQAQNDPPGPNSVNTYMSLEEIFIENPWEVEEKAKEKENAMLRQMAMGLKGQKLRQEMIEKGLLDEDAENEVEGKRNMKEGGLRRAGPIGGGDKLGGMTAGGRRAYVPRHLRDRTNDGGNASVDSSQTETQSIRVSNISVDATEQDIKRFCDPYGKVTRVFLAKDKVTQESRGFAYVSFESRFDAEKALKALNGQGYNHLILSVEWAKPSKRGEGGVPEINRRFETGYGKALPQTGQKK